MPRVESVGNLPSFLQTQHEAAWQNLQLIQTRAIQTTVSQYSLGPPSSHIEQHIAGRVGHHLHLLHLEHHDPDQVLRRTLPEEQGPLPITAG